MSLEQKLIDHPIELPGNPYAVAFGNLGVGQLGALATNLVGTVGVEYALRHTGVSKLQSDMMISTAGPVLEKFGFLPRHIYNTVQQYHGTIESRRKPFRKYLGKNLKACGRDIANDLGAHDPFYGLFMMAGLYAYPDAPSWMISTTSFTAALVAAAGVVVTYNELAHKNFRRRLHKQGFGIEKYHEARFVIRTSDDAERLTHQLAEKFSLGDIKKATYHDRYFESNAPNYSGRGSGVRLRHRIMNDSGVEVKTAQIVFSRASELATRNDQYRYFPQEKEKLYLKMDELPDDPRDLGGLFRKSAGEQIGEVNFVRSLAYTEELMMAVDNVGVNEPFYTLELKTLGDKHKLMSAMRYVMDEFPMRQTTYSKRELVDSATL